MKEYKLGDTIYVKGVVKQIDEYDTALPYCVDFVNGTVWISSDNIIDELPTAEPVKPVLPEKVVLTKKQAEIVERAHGHVMPACYISKQPDDEELLMNAYVNGYAVEKDPVSLVYVPGTNNKFLYNKRGDSSTKIAKLETPIVPSPVTSYQTAYGQYKPLYWFTDAEITKFGLQDCEKEEVTDDGMGC